MKQDSRFDYMRAYAKYFSIVMQMIVLVVVAGFSGKYLDNYFEINNHILTILLIIFATFLALFLFVKSIIK